jgi:hypothetical protein
VSGKAIDNVSISYANMWNSTVVGTVALHAPVCGNRIELFADSEYEQSAACRSRLGHKQMPL